MNDNIHSNTCPKCRQPIPSNAPGGLCPRCLLNATEERPDAFPNARGTPSVAEVQRSFPQLEIIELIGRGGMGCVFKARQARLDRFVALKVLPKELAADPHFSERFSREARVLAKLNHPNIVAVYDFGVADGFHFLLMEYVDGLNLRQAMQAGRFSPVEALAVVPRICEALQFAHDHGVLHRDIKPENILLDASGRVKIADFGIAKLLGEKRPAVTLTATGSAIGSPHYMAPEQLEEPEQVDHRADIYSLGVVFYEMLTGELPLGRFAPPSERVELDRRVDEIVLRALARERELRQSSAGEVKTEVEHVAATAGSKGPAQAKRRLPPLAWAASIAAALLLSAVFYARWREAESGAAPQASAGQPPRNPAAEDAAIADMRLRFAETEEKFRKGETNEQALAKARLGLRTAEARRDAVQHSQAYHSYAAELLEIARRGKDPKEIAAAEIMLAKAEFAVATAKAKGDKKAVAKAQAETAQNIAALSERHFKEGLIDERKLESARRNAQETLRYRELVEKGAQK